MSLIPVLGRQRQVDLCEFEASLLYRMSSKTARTTQRNPVSKKKLRRRRKRRRRRRRRRRKRKRRRRRRIKNHSIFLRLSFENKQTNKKLDSFQKVLSPTLSSNSCVNS